MTSRFRTWGLLVLLVLIGTGCEPYMSMTDPMSADARRAATLLPEHPRFVGMVDVQTVLNEMDQSHKIDSLRHTDHERLRAFLEATDLNLREDIHAIYGAVERSESFSAIVMGDLSPEQVRDYLDQSPDDAGQATTYREAPFFQLTLAEEGTDESSDTLSLAFLDDGLMAIAMETAEVQSIIDRNRDQSTSLSDNEEYMNLMRRVGHGSTAWLMGREVLQTALRDTVEAGTTATVNRAGVQKALLEWSNRVLGLSEMPNVGRGAENKLERLQQRVREQAVSLTWTQTTVDGQIFLTMRDESSASSVMKVAEGAIAALRLSGEKLTERQRDLLDEVTIERDGALVRVQFSLDQELLQAGERPDSLSPVAHRVEASTRRIRPSLHRLQGIKPPLLTLGKLEEEKEGVQPVAG